MLPSLSNTPCFEIMVPLCLQMLPSVLAPASPVCTPSSWLISPHLISFINREIIRDSSDLLRMDNWCSPGVQPAPRLPLSGQDTRPLPEKHLSTPAARGLPLCAGRHGGARLAPGRGRRCWKPGSPERPPQATPEAPRPPQPQEAPAFCPPRPSSLMPAASNSLTGQHAHMTRMCDGARDGNSTCLAGWLCSRSHNPLQGMPLPPESAVGETLRSGPRSPVPRQLCSRLHSWLGGLCLCIWVHVFSQQRPS